MSISIISKYKMIPQTIKVSFWFIIANLIQKGIQIVTTPIYTRILSREQYGQYSVFISWIEIIAVFATLNIFYNGYNVGMSKFEDDRENYTASMYGLCSMLTTVVVICFFLNQNFWCRVLDLPRNMICLLLLYMYILPAFQFWAAKQRFEYKYIALIVVTTFISINTIILGCLFALNSIEKGYAIIIAKIIGEGVVAIPLYIIGVKNVKLMYNKYYWKYALKFNSKLIPHYLSTMILNHSDKIMIKIFSGEKDVAIYSVAYSVAILMTIIQNAINNMFIPYLFKKLSKGEYNSINVIVIRIIILIGILNITIIALAPELISIVASKEYYKAIWVIPPVAMGTFLTAVYGMFINIEFYYEANQFIAGASFGAAITNIILNYLFIEKYGFIIAGYTTFISYLMLTIFHYFVMKYICKKKLGDIKIYNIKRIVLISTCFIILGFGLQTLYFSRYIRYILIILLWIIIIIKANIKGKILKIKENS